MWILQEKIKGSWVFSWYVLEMRVSNPSINSRNLFHNIHDGFVTHLILCRFLRKEQG